MLSIAIAALFGYALGSIATGAIRIESQRKSPGELARSERTMPEAQLCFYAWAARLLADDGQPKAFP